MPHQPSPQQSEFLALTCEEALYGGAAGGGKSDALIFAALQYVDQPGYAAGIFRRTKVEMLMPDSILSRAHTWFSTAVNAGMCRWEAESNTYFFKTRPGYEESLIHFGYVANDGDLNRYQGSRFHYIGVDELSQWAEHRYQYLFSRIRRRKNERIPLRMRAGANPGGQGHAWVKERFIEHAKHITAKSDARADIRSRNEYGSELPAPPVYVSPITREAEEASLRMGSRAEGAHFVPAFSSDNPGLDVNAYNSQLARLDPITQAQLAKGDWDALSSGNFFSLESFEWMEAEPANVAWVRSWDFAGTKVSDKNRDPDWTVGTKCGFVVDRATNTRRFVVADVNRFRKEPGETERAVRAQAEADGKRVRILMEQEPGSAGKSVVNSYITRVLVGWRVIAVRKTGEKSEGWRPLSGFASASKILLVRGPWNKAFVEELSSIPVGHDDQADTVAQAFTYETEQSDGAERQRALAALG